MNKVFKAGTILVSLRQQWSMRGGSNNRRIRIPKGYMVLVEDEMKPDSNIVYVISFFEDMSSSYTYPFYANGFRKAHQSEIEKYNKAYEVFENEQIQMDEHQEEMDKLYKKWPTFET